MDNNQQIQEWVNGFVQAWKEYTLYCRDKITDKVEDLAAFDSVLSELSSGFPKQFVNAYLFDKISENMLRRAEKFDNDLFRVRLVALNLDKEKKEIATIVFRHIETFLAFCAKCKAQQEGRWSDD